tara:strand:+ start:181 stop:309 length:129 start_codon:yes stop_codon:yes gene_type:complete
MDYLEQLKEEGILDLIAQLGELTDEELEALVQANKSGQMGVA